LTPCVVVITPKHKTLFVVLVMGLMEDADNEGKMILEYTYDNTGVPNCGRLPEAVTNIVELNLKLGVVGDDDEEQILIGMNDDGSTFDEIADYIEDEL
jgi:hypothetical protein